MAEYWQSLLTGLVAIKMYLVLFAIIGTFMLLERFFPAERGQPVHDRVLTAQFTLLYFLVTPFVVILPMYLVTAIGGATGGSLFTINIDEINTGSAPFDWVLHYMLFPAIPFIAYDFFYYWNHRLQHTVPALWEQHKLHHMDESVYCISSGRHHWLEEGIRVFTMTIPMSILITIGSSLGMVAAFIYTYWAFVIHANVRLPFGPATPLLCGPQLHRIHHSRDPQHRDKNFAAFFPLWDILFGTYHRPRRDEWVTTGIPSREVVGSFWEGVVLPFRAWVPAIGTQVRRFAATVTRLLRGQSR